MPIIFGQITNMTAAIKGLRYEVGTSVTRSGICPVVKRTPLSRRFGLGRLKNILSASLVLSFYDLQNELSHDADKF